MLPAPRERVSRNTSDCVNEKIRRRTAANVQRYAGTSPQEIESRLRELDEEWDIERCLETMAPTISLLGIGLGLTTSKKWFMLPLLVQGFFLQHALQGWCPPLTVLRHLGIRTQTEINEERYALKAMRGDFHGADDDGRYGDSRRAMLAAQE